MSLEKVSPISEEEKNYWPKKIIVDLENHLLMKEAFCSPW